MAIINPLRKYIASKPDVDIYLEHMNVLLIEDSLNLKDYSQFLFRQYHYPPKAIVFLGASALMLGEDLKEHWGEEIPPHPVHGAGFLRALGDLYEQAPHPFQ